VRLEPLELRLVRQGGPLLDQVRTALAAHGQPLRWAITAVESSFDGPVLVIEAVMVQEDGCAINDELAHPMEPSA
jgi:hypothetical protein